MPANREPRSVLSRGGRQGRRVLARVLSDLEEGKLKGGEHSLLASQGAGGHTASLRSFAFFRLMHRPHHVQPTTRTRARTTPAAVPPAMAAIGTFDERCCISAPTVGRLAEPPEVTVVVRMECDGVTSTTVVIAVGVGELEPALCLAVALDEAVDDAGAIRTLAAGAVGSSPGKKSRTPRGVRVI